MANVTVTKDRYTADSLFQWDKNQTLVITGLSLPSIPEIHFVGSGMDKAIVRQASMDSAGVVRVEIPNSLLQTAGKIKVYVCIYTGNEFNSLYMVEVLVKARTKPSDYTLENDTEEYSFKALENQVVNALATMESQHDDALATFAKAQSDLATAISRYNASVAELNEAIETFNQTSAELDAATTRMDELTEQLERVEIAAVTERYTASIPVSWTSDATNGGYKQTVSVSGILATDTPMVDVILGNNAATNSALLEAWALVSRITTANGSITLYCIEAAPVTTFDIQLKVVR